MLTPRPYPDREGSTATPNYMGKDQNMEHSDTVARYHPNMRLTKFQVPPEVEGIVRALMSRGKF